jgi:deazaflavin-dependent oxidoreductase (nitroreductase family)
MDRPTLHPRVALRGSSDAAAWADGVVATVRDDPEGRMALMARCYRGPFGEAPRHLPYRRAAMSFMRWQLRRDVLQPPSAPRPGSAWWRAVNERILRDGCEAVARSGSLPGPVSSPTIDHWMAFVDDPTARSWYRAHNGSVVAGYLEHRDLAEAENAAERFFMNVVLCRVLFTHALVAAPGLSLGWLRPLAPLLGDPRLGMAGIFLQLSRILPAEYPLGDGVATYLDAELGFGQLVDYGVIVPRLQQLYEWSAHELGAPGLLECVRDGALTYAWPYEERDVWHAPDSFVVRVVHRTLPPARNEVAMADGSAAQKRRRVRWIQRFLLNPPAKVAVWCGLVPGFVLVETTGRRSGKRRRNVVGMRTEGDTGWVVAEHGRHAGYVRNLEANPDVRVRMHRRWRPAQARIVDDDDPQARLDSFGRRSHEAAVRRFGTDLLTIQFEFGTE